MWYCFIVLLACFVFAICCVCKLGKFQITCPKVKITSNYLGIIFSLVPHLASLLDFIFIL